MTGSRGSNPHAPAVRPATPADGGAIERLHRRAFGAEGDTIVTLLGDLARDPTAAPRLSLVAEADGEAVGHVLFTAARIEPGPPGLTCRILAPLAVDPGRQGRGIGTALVRAGLDVLDAAGVDLVFVLGDPAYYGRFGFVPATPAGLVPPHPLVPEFADAWMERTRAGSPGAQGRVRCADVLEEPRYWRP
ncbi:MAG: N-acetyltransferase [Chromatiales bacterium]|nr:N-acetyltransferase [Chromatiales bacterium]